MRKDPPDAGFALLIVAIALATLSLIFAAALGTSRQHLAMSSAELRRTTMSAATDAAIATVEYELASAGASTPSVLYTPQTIMVGGISVTVSVRPESSKLDLNAAEPTALRRYFELSGLDAQRARALVDQIVARREVARISQSSTRYENHLGSLFQTISEIADLRGGNRDVVDCTAPDLTVFTGTPYVDAFGASERVREALGIPARANIPAMPLSAITSGHAIVAGEILEVTAVAASTGGERVSRQIVIRVTGNLRKPIWTLAQTTPAPDLQTSQRACDRLGPQSFAAAHS